MILANCPRCNALVAKFKETEATALETRCPHCRSPVSIAIEHAVVLRIGLNARKVYDSEGRPLMIHSLTKKQ